MGTLLLPGVREKIVHELFTAQARPLTEVTGVDQRRLAGHLGRVSQLGPRGRLRHPNGQAEGIPRYNRDRPHQALGMRVPADLYTRSPRVYRGLEDPFHDATFTVTHCGRICFHGRKINLSHVFAGQNVGVTQVGDHVWLVTFMQYDLGYFDDEVGRVEPISDPLRLESVTYVAGMDLKRLAHMANIAGARQA